MSSVTPRVQVLKCQHPPKTNIVITIPNTEPSNPCIGYTGPFRARAHGQIVPIDFGYSFGIGSLLPVPELMPFRPEA